MADARASPRSEWRLVFPLILLVLIAAATIGHAAREVSGEPGATFEELDADGDGFVSREEARVLEGFEAAFDRADEGGAGRLDADGFASARAFYDRMRAEQLIDDSMTTARVKMALLRDPQVNGLDVKVETARGMVELTGVVADEAQARRAVEVASGVRGVYGVHSSLLVRTAEAADSADRRSGQ